MTLRVRNWEKFQHYKDRNPPWVKLYTAWPDDYEWSSWSDASKLLAVCIVMLAGRVGNRIPNDPAWIQQRCGLKKVPDLTELIGSNFIEEIQELPDKEQDASNPLASCQQVASDPLAIARSRETDRQRQRDGASAPSVNGSSKTPRAVPIPADLTLTDPMRSQALAKFPDCDADEMFTNFRAHHEAHGKALKNWGAAWTTWLGNAVKFGYPKRTGGSNGIAVFRPSRAS